MSIKAVSWALKLQIDDPVAKLILLGLANHHNDIHDECIGFDGELERVACVESKAVRRKLEFLALDGWIVIDHGPQGRSRYSRIRIIFERGQS